MPVSTKLPSDDMPLLDAPAAPSAGGSWQESIRAVLPAFRHLTPAEREDRRVFLWRTGKRVGRVYPSPGTCHGEPAGEESE